MSDKKEVGYVGQFAANIADGMSVTINFNMPDASTKEDFSAKIDLLRGVAERQRAKNEVPMLEGMIAEKEAMLRNAHLDLAQYLKKHSENDDHAVRIKSKIEEMVADIARGHAKLAETRDKAK